MRHRFIVIKHGDHLYRQWVKFVNTCWFFVASTNAVDLIPASNPVRCYLSRH